MAEIGNPTKGVKEMLPKVVVGGVVTGMPRNSNGMTRGNGMGTRVGIGKTQGSAEHARWLAVSMFTTIASASFGKTHKLPNKIVGPMLRQLHLGRGAPLLRRRGVPNRKRSRGVTNPGGQAV